MFKSLVNQKISVKQKEAESLWAETKIAMQCKTLALLKPLMLGSSLLSTIQTGSS